MRRMGETKPIAPAATATAPGKSPRRGPSTGTRRGGRPSRSAAQQLRNRILEVATELFLIEGYGSTSIEGVAARAGVSKRTFYHRFDNKEALFAAVVHRIVEQIRPPPEIPLLQGANLEEVLYRLAGIILQAALSPQALALHRLISAESARFPHLADAVYNGPAKHEALNLISGLLARDLPGAGLTSNLQRFAAEQFLQMIVVVPQRRCMGVDSPMTAKELDAWARSTVRLFLGGCRGLLEKPSSRRRP